MKVLLLAGGKSNEREVSLRSGQTVAKALDDLGYEYVLADPAENGYNLENLVDGVDVVFPALHGSGGEDGILQAELERLKIPCVGSDSKASKLCFDKWAYKQLLRDNGLPLSSGQQVTKQDIESSIFDSPYVLKPIEGGSSLDTQIVRNPDKASRQSSLNLLNVYPSMLHETLVEGVEITVGILDKEPLPVIEVVPPEGEEFDYNNKYNGSSQELFPPVHVGEDLQIQAQELALKIHNLTSCYGMSRTDMMIDSDGNLHVLETNTIPGLTEQSLLPKMVVAAGYSISEFVEQLINLAISR